MGGGGFMPHHYLDTAGSGLSEVLGI